jgi:hypothetical protein
MVARHHQGPRIPQGPAQTCARWRCSLGLAIKAM